MAAIDKVRVVVVGDSGVGKTSLVHLIVNNESAHYPASTIGCSVEVKLHDYKAGTPYEKTYFIELWDVGGSMAHKNSRGIFYSPVNGIILVHDLTNRKSQLNLKKWLAEVMNKDSRGHHDLHDDYDQEQFAGTQIPILVIGTKCDLAEAVREKSLSRVSAIAEECGADEISVNCNLTRSLAAGSSNAVKLSKFFDKVIERRYHQRENQLGTPDKRRQFSPGYGSPYSSSPYSKSSFHVD